MALISLGRNKNNQPSETDNQGVRTFNPDPTVQAGAQAQAVSQPPVQKTDISENLQSNLNQINASTTPSNPTAQPVVVQNPVVEQTQTAIQPQLQQQAPAQSQTEPVANENGTIQTNERDFTLQELLNEAITKQASDIHLSVGNRGILRIDGELTRMNTKVLTNEYMTSIAQELLKQRKDTKVEDIAQFDMGYDLDGHRFRVNIFRQQGNLTIVARLVPSEIKTVEELGLPPVLKELGTVSGGLVLVTGPTGSGKSTSLAAVLNHINQTQSKHIMTVEDPIEFIFPKANCLVNQREFGLDFDSWPKALKAILRQDPDIVLVGEMRDLETIASAITLSETGHLVFATLHTNSASQTMDRIIDVFPEGQQSQIRAQLSNVITAVIAQRLVPLAKGGRKAVMEIMLANPAVRNTIREGKTHQIDNMIQTGQDMGMVSMSRSLAELVSKGEISVEIAQSYSPHPEELESLLKNML